MYLMDCVCDGVIGDMVQWGAGKVVCMLQVKSEVKGGQESWGPGTRKSGATALYSGVMGVGQVALLWDA